MLNRLTTCFMRYVKSFFLNKIQGFWKKYYTRTRLRPYSLIFVHKKKKKLFKKLFPLPQDQRLSRTVSIAWAILQSTDNYCANAKPSPRKCQRLKVVLSKTCQKAGFTLIVTNTHIFYVRFISNSRQNSLQTQGLVTSLIRKTCFRQ